MKIAGKEHRDEREREREREETELKERAALARPLLPSERPTGSLFCLILILTPEYL